MLILALTVFYAILGCFLDGISMVVLTMGVILPTVQAAGLDLVWFGIFIVIVVEMAQITPPVGFNLFVLQGMTDLQADCRLRSVGCRLGKQGHSKVVVLPPRVRGGSGRGYGRARHPDPPPPALPRKGGGSRPSGPGSPRHSAARAAVVARRLTNRR